jgi:hypothetical protein
MKVLVPVLIFDLSTQIVDHHYYIRYNTLQKTATQNNTTTNDNLLEPRVSVSANWKGPQEYLAELPTHAILAESHMGQMHEMTMIANRNAKECAIQSILLIHFLIAWVANTSTCELKDTYTVRMRVYCWGSPTFWFSMRIC